MAPRSLRHQVPNLFVVPAQVTRRGRSYLEII